MATRQDLLGSQQTRQTAASIESTGKTSLASPAEIITTEKSMEYLTKHSIPYYLQDALFILSRHKQMYEEAAANKVQATTASEKESSLNGSVKPDVSGVNENLFMYEYFALLDKGEWMVGREFEHLIATRRTVDMFCNKLEMVLTRTAMNRKNSFLVESLEDGKEGTLLVI